MCFGWYWVALARMVLADEASAGPEFLQMDLALTDADAATDASAGAADFFLWHADAHADPFYQSETRPGLLIRKDGTCGWVVEIPRCVLND